MSRSRSGHTKGRIASYLVIISKLTFLIYGANSAQGIPVVRRLLKANNSLPEWLHQQVRVFVRDSAKAQSLFGKDVEIATGTLEDKASLRCANEGIDRVFLVLPLEYRFDVAVTQGQNPILLGETLRERCCW